MLSEMPPLRSKCHWHGFEYGTLHLQAQNNEKHDIYNRYFVCPVLQGTNAHSFFYRLL